MSLYFTGWAGTFTGFGAADAGASSDAPETKYSVVLFPSELRFHSKCDKALYALAIIASDSAPRTAQGERLPSFSMKPPRVRLTGLEYDFA